MIKAELWHEIHSRFKLKEKKKSIARTIGLSVQTVRKILRQKQPKAYDRKKQESELLGSYQDYILRRLAAVGYCTQAIFEEIQVRGYQGSYQTDLPPINRSGYNEKKPDKRRHHGQGQIHGGTDHRQAA